MSIFSDQLVLWVVNVLIHTTVLTALLLLIAMLFRRQAAMRYWILCCGLLLVFASPAISAFIQSQGNSWLALAAPSDTATVSDGLSGSRSSQTLDITSEIQTLESSATRVTVSEPINETTGTMEFIDPSTAINPVVLPAAEAPADELVKSRPLMQWLGTSVAIASMIWAVGAAVLLLRMIIGWIRLSRILNRADPIEDVGFQAAFTRACAAVGCDERRAPRLVASDEISGPLAAGLFGGSVVLPKQLIAQADPIELADVLIHEVAHVVRRDQIVVLVQNLVSAIYWPHPLVRKLNRELAKAREEVCDNFVLATTTAPVYSRTLLSLAQLVQRPETIPGSVGFFASRWKLEQRVAGLLDEARDRTTFLSLRGWAFVAAAMLLLLAAISLGTITIATAQTDEKNSADRVSLVDEITVRGVVLKPDGSPAAGAIVRTAAPVYADMRGVLGEHFETVMQEVVADAQGRFEVSIDTEPYGDMPVAGTEWEDFWKRTVIAATTPEFGGQWLKFADIEGENRVTLQLVEDQLIRGRVIDLEGQSRSGVTVEVKDILAARNENLDGWLKAVRNGEPAWTAARNIPRQCQLRLLGVPKIVTSDRDGVFEIKGLGRERCIRLHAHGNGIAFENFQVATRSMAPMTWNDIATPDWASMVFGSEFTLTGRPARTVDGTVTDSRTGKPLAGVDVGLDTVAGKNRGGMWLLPNKTDDRGRFRFDAIPKGEGTRLLFRPTNDQPYFMREMDVPDPDGIDKISMDVELHRGVWIEGTVVDKRSREPVSGVRVHYFPYLTNKYADEIPEFDPEFGGPNRYNTDANGKYRLVGLPGPAVVCFQSIHQLFRSGNGYEKLTAPKDESGVVQTYGNLGLSPKWADSMVEVDVDAETPRVELNAELDPGDVIRVSVFDQAGKWLTGAILKSSNQRITVERDPVDLLAINPTETRIVVIHHEQRGLGIIHHITPSEIAIGNVQLTAQRCIRIFGKLVQDGVPLSGISVIPTVLPDEDYSISLATVTTDENGDFECTLPPGCKYKLRLEGLPFRVARVDGDIDVSPGDALDLGSLELTEGSVFKRVNPANDGSTHDDTSSTTIQGKVIDSQNQIVGNAKVAVTGLNLGLQFVMTEGSWDSDPNASEDILRADIEYRDNFSQNRNPSDFDIETDKDGRLRFTDLIPGANYQFLYKIDGELAAKRFSVKPGQQLDLGNIVIDRGDD